MSDVVATLTAARELLSAPNPTPVPDAEEYGDIRQSLDVWLIPIDRARVGVRGAIDGVQDALDLLWDAVKDQTSHAKAEDAT